MIYWTLFTAAFVSATFLPGSSEVVLVAALQQAAAMPLLLWAAATAGNVLGTVINWYLGRYCLHWQHKRWFPVTPEKLAQAEQRFNERGLWMLLFAWVPIIGDALTVAAGLLRVRLDLFLLFVTIGKGLRYAIVIVLALYLPSLWLL